MKIITNTEATAVKYLLRQHGTVFPQEGAMGLGFPYRQPKRLTFSESLSFKRGLENPIRILTKKELGEHEKTKRRE